MGGRHGGRTRAAPARGDDDGPAGGLAAVRARLQGYADRGVFRGLAEEPVRGGRHRFRFLWLAPTPLTLGYQPSTGRLVFRDLLPNLPPRSDVAVALRRYIAGRGARELPDHRRIDPRRAAVSCAVRGGALTVAVVAKRRHHGYAVHRAVNLVHEIFVQLYTYFPEYMWENFDAPQE